MSNNNLLNLNLKSNGLKFTSKVDENEKNYKFELSHQECNHKTIEEILK